jgi:hypothetical protein
MIRKLKGKISDRCMKNRDDDAPRLRRPDGSRREALASLLTTYLDLRSEERRGAVRLEG